MSNETDQSTSVANQIFAQRVIFSTEGLILSVSNGLIVLVVLRYNQLRRRKEYFIMMARAFADMSFGLGFAIAGIRRMYIDTSGQGHMAVTAFHCFWVNILLTMSGTLSSLMTVVISFDRLFAVAFPIKYIKNTICYGYLVVGCVLGYGIIHFISALIASLSQTKEKIYTPICYFSWGLGSTFTAYHFGLESIAYIIAVVLYAFVPFVYRKRMAKVDSGKISIQNRNDMRFQKRLMKTMGISVAVTCVCIIIPLSFEWAITVYYKGGFLPDWYWSHYIPLFNILRNLDPIANFAIYARRQEEFWMAVSYFLKCKELPANFEICGKKPQKRPGAKAKGNTAKNN